MKFSEMESWSNLCRCCLSPNSEVSLLNNEHNVKEKFLQITTIEVKEDDGLPQKLCEECFNIMNSAYQFRTQCMKMDKELKLQLDAIINESKEDTLSQFSQIETQVKASEDMTIEDIAKESMKQLESIIKTEPNDDEDYYYVLVIDNPKDKEKKDKEEKNIVKDTKASHLNWFDHVNVKKEIELNEIDANEMQREENSESQFANRIDSFLVSHPKISDIVPATILENEDVQDGDSQFDQMEIEINPTPQDQLENIDKEALTVIDKETLSVYEGQESPLEELKISLSNDIIKNLPNKNVIKILTPTGEERTILLKESDDVKYLSDGSDSNKLISQPEIIYCEGDESSQYQILKCDGQDIVIEYTDDSQIATVLQQEDGSFLCECGKEFKDISDYEKHQFEHNPAGEHFCNLCGKGFESVEILTGHMLLHTVTGLLVTCPYCNQIIKRNSLTQHIKYVHNDKPKCLICSKTFANSNNLKRHMMIHKGIRDFECDICHKKFGQKITMQTHRLTHINPFTCNLCGITFDSKPALTEHKEKGECTRSKILKVKEELMKTVKQEITSNLGKILGYACSLCKKMFSLESALEAHIEDKHIVEAIDVETEKGLNKKPMKKFECSVCGKGCASQAMLVMHERVHTNERPFPCQLCSLRFKTKTHLRTHQLTHTREKKFGCSVCMKFFALKGNLVVHLRTHTGERPYICSICNEAFIDSKYLKKHKLKRHSIQNVPWHQY